MRSGSGRKTTSRLAVLTIGHSTHTLAKFVAMLKAHNVVRIVDVRSIPKSRHVPQFDRQTSAAHLRARGIGYVHLKSLGGRRHTNRDSINGGWRNASFRGYADYMATREFRLGLMRLLTLARGKHCAILCAEALPWRCHRSLIGDALLVRGVPVEDILSAKTRREHVLTPFARVREITYPTERTQQ